jgi:hypothetical protein
VPVAAQRHFFAGLGGFRLPDADRWRHAEAVQSAFGGAEVFGAQIADDAGSA